MGVGASPSIGGGKAGGGGGRMCSLDVLAIVAKLAADCDLPAFALRDTLSLSSASSASATASPESSPSSSPTSMLVAAPHWQAGPHTGVLQRAYEQNRYPNKSERKRLASAVRKTERQVAGWFQNKRQRDKRLWESAATATATGVWAYELETTG